MHDHKEGYLAESLRQSQTEQKVSLVKIVPVLVIGTWMLSSACTTVNFALVCLHGLQDLACK